MENIFDLITLDDQNEHDLEHDLSHKPQFSEPKIYDANGDLNKRWYVYFSFQDPKTGRLKRMKNIYGKVNSHKTKEARYYLLSLYRRRLLKFLKAGYNPYENNTALYLKHQEQTDEASPKGAIGQPEKPQPVTEGKAAVPSSAPKPPQETPKEESTGMNLQDALNKALELKTNLVSDRTLSDYKIRFNGLKKWLKEHHPEVTTITQVSKGIVVEFLNGMQLKSSARNRNNYRTCFSTIFQVLEDNEIIPQNIIKSIPKLKTKPKRNKTYTPQQQQEIFDYLETKDPTLLLFIKFVSYNLLRPKEVCRLKVKDINLATKTVEFKAKNKPLKTKLIPQILLNDLPDLSNMDGELMLFTPQGIGGKWEATLENRRGYFTERFRKVVKHHFGLDENYGLYSFRHTFITKLYRSLVKDSSPFAAKSSLMEITGHTSMTSLEKYLRDIDAELPQDYSNLL